MPLNLFQSPPPLGVCENDCVFRDQFIALLSYHRV